MTMINDIQFRTDMGVQLVRSMGNDADLCQAARVSTIGTDSLHTGEASGLIDFLMRGRHGTPFEHGAMTFLIEAPIFVFREFHRHRVGWSYNEMSGRYRVLDPVFYIPAPDRPLVQVGKAGAYTFEPGSLDQQVIAVQGIRRANRTAWEEYSAMLHNGVAKEIARSVLPVNIYSSMYATCNPRSLMHFLGLRTKNHDNATFPSFPMEEIAMVADQMEAEFSRLFPLTHSAFEKNGRVAP